MWSLSSSGAETFDNGFVGVDIYICLCVFFQKIALVMHCDVM